MVDVADFLCFNPSIMANVKTDWEGILKHVSRSFYLTLRILPHSIRRPISLAYLLARASDTIADTRLVQVQGRREALLRFRECIQKTCEGRKTVPPDFGDLAEAHDKTAGEGNPAERILLERMGELLDALGACGPEDRPKIRKLLDTITRGQETDLMRFGANSDLLSAFDTDEELDRYTYDVAGCVGEFWTDMCLAHVFPPGALDHTGFRMDGVLFGKGLQLINVLRDIPKDLRRGRCYIPRSQLASCGLRPEDLLHKDSMNRFRPVYEIYLNKAEDYLRAGWRYTVALPYQCIRVRLACAWPLLIGARTLEKLRASNVLDDSQPLKVSRSELRRLLLRSIAFYPVPNAWNRLYDAQAEKTQIRSSR